MVIEVGGTSLGGSELTTPSFQAKICRQDSRVRHFIVGHDAADRIWGPERCAACPLPGVRRRFAYGETASTVVAPHWLASQRTDPGPRGKLPT